jgi:hypothetical protein
MGRIELSKARRGQQPLLDVRRFTDRAFAFSVLALVFMSIVMFGLLFLLPIYLQNLHQQTALQAGATQMAEALALLATLPLADRLTDKIGPRPVALAGLIVLAGAAALMMTLALNTPIWMVVGILIVFGCGLALGFQIPVAAMSRIKQEEQQEIANGSTLISVIRGTAAPMGVALLSSIVQARALLRGTTGGAGRHRRAVTLAKRAAGDAQQLPGRRSPGARRTGSDAPGSTRRKARAASARRPAGGSQRERAVRRLKVAPSGLRPQEHRLRGPGRTLAIE